LLGKKSANRVRKNGASERGPVVDGSHDGLRALHLQTVLTKRFRRACVARVANKKIEKIFVSFGYARD